MIMSPSPNIGGTCPPCPIWIDTPDGDSHLALGDNAVRRISVWPQILTSKLPNPPFAVIRSRRIIHQLPIQRWLEGHTTVSARSRRCCVTVQLMLTIAQCVVCPSVRLSHSCTLLMPFDRIRCHLADTRVEMGHGREIFGGPNSQSKCGPQIAA